MPARYNEIDAHAAAWLRNLIALGELPNGVVDERSIVDLRGDDLAGCDELHLFAGIGVWARAVRDAEAAAGHRFPRPLFTGSCPCQPLSVAGQRQGHVDQRHLWPAFHRLIDFCRPATILGEQVAGKDGREWMAAVRHDLEASGYAVGTAILPAGGFGAPHIRYRMFFVAHAGRWDQGECGYANQMPDERHGAAGSASAIGRSGAVGFVADAEGGARLQERERDGRISSGAGGPEFGRGAEDALAWVAHALASLRRRRRRRGRSASSGGAGLQRAELHDVDGRSPHCDWPGPPDSFWSDADWIFCRDGKWRPIEPGSFPLVDGSAFRLGSGGPYEGMSRAGMLRGYGNAVVLPVARAFVECAMEALHAH